MWGLTEKKFRPEIEVFDQCQKLIGRDGAKGPVAIANRTNMHTGDQAMQSLISIGEAYADKIAQPSLTIYGTSAIAAPCSTQFVEKLTNEHEELAFDGFSHVDIDHKPEAIQASTNAVAEFFGR